MKKFNIRKVLDGLTAVSSSSSSSASTQPTNRENDIIQETLQSEHFQLCKVGAFYYASIQTLSPRLHANISNINLIWDPHASAMLASPVCASAKTDLQMRSGSYLPQHGK